MEDVEEPDEKQQDEKNKEEEILTSNDSKQTQKKIDVENEEKKEANDIKILPGLGSGPEPPKQNEDYQRNVSEIQEK